MPDIITIVEDITRKCFWVVYVYIDILIETGATGLRVGD